MLKWQLEVRLLLYIYITISTVKTQHLQKPGAYLQLGYFWRHVSAVNPLALELDIYSLAHHLCKM